MSLSAVISALKTIIPTLKPILKEGLKIAIPIAMDKLKEWFSAKPNLPEVESGKSFDASKARIDELLQMRKSIATYKNDTLRRVSKGIDEIIGGFKNTFKEFGKKFEGIDENLVVDMQDSSLRYFDRAKERLKQTINTQISFENESFAGILRQESGGQKTHDLFVLINATKAKALHEFQNELENGLNSVFKLVNERLVGKLNSTKAMTEQGVRFLQEYQNATDKLGKEKQQIELAKDIAINSAYLNALSKR